MPQPIIWKRVLKRIAMLLLIPLVLAAILAALSAVGVFSIPLLTGFSSAAIGGFVFMVAAGSGVGLSGLLWMMQERLSKLTGRKAYGYVGVSFLIGFTFLSVGIVGFSLSLSSIGVFASLGAFGGPLAIGIICLGGSAVMVAMIAKLMEIMYKSKPSTQDKKQKKPLVDDDEEEEEVAPSPNNSSPVPLTGPPLPNIQEQESPSSGSCSLESIETIKITIASRLPANPFKKIKLLPLNANFAEEWENDGPKLREFFSSLCESTKTLVMEFPGQKQYILEMTEQSLNKCKNGLMGRYHSDRFGTDIVEKINDHSLFKCIGTDNLFEAILNYRQTGWEDRVMVLLQSARGITQAYGRIAKTNKETTESTKEIRENIKETREMNKKTREKYQEINQAYDKIGDDQARIGQDLERLGQGINKLNENIAEAKRVTAEDNKKTNAALDNLEQRQRILAENLHMFFSSETDVGLKTETPESKESQPQYSQEI